jgi:hypothetical protein
MLHIEHDCPVGCEQCEHTRKHFSRIAERERELEKEAELRKEWEETEREKHREFMQAMRNLDEQVFSIFTSRPDQEAVLKEKAKIVLKALYQEEEYEKIIAKLLEGEEVVVRYLQENVPAFEELMSKPTREVLLAYKDKMHIPDHRWHITVHTFRLGDYATIHHLKKIRKQENEELPIVMTPGGNGAQIDLLTYLKWCLEGYDPLLPDDESLLLKLVYDGGRMTSRTKKAQEIGTFNLLFPGQSLSEIRSPRNSHQWIIFFAEETRENLRQELKDGIKVINRLIAGL